MENPIVSGSKIKISGGIIGIPQMEGRKLVIEVSSAQLDTVM